MSRCARDGDRHALRQMNVAEDIITIAWSAIILSFAAAKVLVALPLIIESIKELFAKYEVKDPNAVTVAEMLVPISYPFPNTGKLLSLFFIPFAAWFVGLLMIIWKCLF